MARYLNTFFTTLIVFFTAFCWIYYLTKTPKLSLFTAFLVAVATFCLCCLKGQGKKINGKKIAKQLGLQFTLFGDDGAIDDLYRYFGYNLTDNIAKKDNCTVLVEKCFTVSNLSADKVVTLAKTAVKLGCNRLDIFCEQSSPAADKYAQACQIPVNVYDCHQLYDLFIQYHKLPALKNSKKVTNSPTLDYVFNKKRTRYYVISSVFTYLLSFLSYFPIYSLVWATVLLALGLYSRFNTKFNRKQSKIKL